MGQSYGARQIGRTTKMLQEALDTWLKIQGTYNLTHVVAIVTLNTRHTEYCRRIMYEILFKTHTTDFIKATFRKLWDRTIICASLESLALRNLCGLRVHFFIDHSVDEYNPPFTDTWWKHRDLLFERMQYMRCNCLDKKGE